MDYALKVLFGSSKTTIYGAFMGLIDEEEKEFIKFALTAGYKETAFKIPVKTPWEEFETRIIKVKLTGKDHKVYTAEEIEEKIMRKMTHITLGKILNEMNAENIENAEDAVVKIFKSATNDLSCSVQVDIEPAD